MASRRLRNSGLKRRSTADLEPRLRGASSGPRRPARCRRGRPRQSRCVAALSSRDAGVGRHDQDDVAEVGLAAGVVGERRVIHHLQQDVHHIRMRLLDLVEQHDVVRMLAHRIHQQAALLEAHVARRSANQPRHRVLLHVLAHVEARELVAQVNGELRASSVLPTPVGPVNRKQPAGRSGMPRPARDALDRARHQRHGFFLAEHDALSASPSVRRRSLSDEDAWRAGILAMRATTCSISATSTGSGGSVAAGASAVAVALPAGPSARLRRTPACLHPHHGAGFVEQVDGAVGQAVVAQVPRGQLRSGFDGRRRVGDAVMLLVALLQPLQDAHGLLDRRLLQGDLLEPPRQRAVLLDLLVLVERRRADDAQAARREHRLQQRRQVHRAAGRRAGADDAVQLVDEENRIAPLLAARRGRP